MKTLVINGEILTPDRHLTGRMLEIDQGKISAIRPIRDQSDPDTRVINANGLYLVPGFIDLHIHGAKGSDTMDATPEAIDGISQFLVKHGVTSFLPTTISADSADIHNAINNLVTYTPSSQGAIPLGIHIEGPYLNEAYGGAQPKHHLRPADAAEYDPWLSSGQVRLITAAPEVPGVLDLIDAGVLAGIEFAIGHSQASYEQTLDAADHGLRQVTHIFNGIPALHHRTPGILGAALTDERIYCQVIVDGVHVHPAVVDLLIRTKGTERVILVSDSIRAVGLDDGDYPLGDQSVRVRAGVVRTSAGGLAGSTLTMDQALLNVMDFASLSLQQALPMATTVPAEAMGLSGIKGELTAGADADIVFLDDKLQVRMTMIAGNIVFKN